MANIFFGFALAASMFANNCTITHKLLTTEEAKAMIAAGVTPCLNPSHQATIAAMQQRFGINVEIPTTPPKVVLNPGDKLIVMGATGLPRLTDRHEYTPQEIASAEFRFQLFTVS